MTLREKQSKFALLISKLILWAYDEGYEVTLGDAFAKSGHVENSFHYIRLALDINLFRNGVYLTRTEAHAPLGQKWKSYDPECIWGGDFKRKDGNHYSFGEHENEEDEE